MGYKRMRIGLCVRGFTRIIELLTEALPNDDIFECDHTEVIDIAKDTDVFIPTVAPIPAAAFSAPRLKLVQQYGVGLDSVDIPAATRAGVLVANIPSVGTGNAESVAEFAIAHMLMLSRHIPSAFERFAEKRVGSPLGRCLWQSTIVILGYGGIGEEIARRLAGFGVRIIAVSRHGPDGMRVRDPSVHIDLHLSADALGDAVAEADFLIVAAPATPENIGLVDASVFARIKPGAYIVNIARGPVIDYDALLAALRNGRVAGAGLDVFWHEPFDPDDPLCAENVIATPHIGGVTERSLVGIGQAVAANVERVRRGEMPTCCANPEAGLARLQSR
ncbi:MAG: hydroxyacid dehydrogenase [Proteobacteria bacterium]|nr:MAG: hydroxyacid dehydrogenase [Pseudomonadota bacterium]